MKFFAFFFSLLLSANPVMANGVAINSFAYGYLLDIDNNGPIYSFDVPDHVYQTVTQSNYADLRVFNTEGIAVPHFVRHEKAIIEQNVADVGIPLFPMAGDTNKLTSGNGAPAIRIQTNAEGAIVNIDPVQGINSNDTTVSKIDSYILDISQLDNKPLAFTLNWSDDQGDFNETVTVSGSNDLANWRTLATNAPLTNLHFAGHHIVKRRVDIRNHHYKYLRLKWSNPKQLLLTSVVGHYSSTYKDKPRNTLSVSSNRFDMEQRGFYFTTNGHYPVDKVTVRLTPKNAILLATLSSSDKPDGPWVQRYSGLVYNLEKNRKTVTPSEINLPNINDKYWRVMARNERDGLANMAPTLEIGWLPHKLLFVAQGNPPFKLAYGHSQVGINNSSALNQLLHKQPEDEKLGVATVGQQFSFSGNSALLPPPPDNAEKWKIAILWAVLLIGLLALLVMVIRLYKQMDSERSSS